MTIYRKHIRPALMFIITVLIGNKPKRHFQDDLTDSEYGGLVGMSLNTSWVLAKLISMVIISGVAVVYMADFAVRAIRPPYYLPGAIAYHMASFCNPNQVCDLDVLMPSYAIGWIVFLYTVITLVSVLRSNEMLHLDEPDEEMVILGSRIDEVYCLLDDLRTRVADLRWSSTAILPQDEDWVIARNHASEPFPAYTINGIWYDHDHNMVNVSHWTPISRNDSNIGSEAVAELRRSQHTAQETRDKTHG